MSVPCFPERRLNSYYCCVWDRNRISIITQAGLKLKSLLSCAPPPSAVTVVTRCHLAGLRLSEQKSGGEPEGRSGVQACDPSLSGWRGSGVL